MGDAAHEVADRMAEAAGNWLASLDADQRGVAQWPWPSDEERVRWYYTPTDHGGLTIGAMRPAQQQLGMMLVASGMSEAGYVTAATIMGLENVLDRLEGFTVRWERERGRDPGMYYLRVFGDPGGDAPWSWRFGGHHVSLNTLVVDGQVRSTTPCFLGSDPAWAPLLGQHLLRPLAAAEDLGRDLVRSLTERQAAGALLTPVAPVDIVAGNRARVSDGDEVIPLSDIWRGYFDDRSTNEGLRRTFDTSEQRAGTRPADREAVRLTATPKGLPARELDDAQRDQLRALLDVYLGRIPDELAEREAAKFAGDRLGDVHFAWAGSTEPGRPHYYRLQGPRLLVEYDNTQRDVNHVHTVWRDPEADFGHDVLAAHRAAYH